MEIKNKLEDTWFFLLNGEIKNKNQFNKRITRIKIEIKNKLEKNCNFLIEWWNWKEKSI
jgi:hypothetical protein